MLAASIVRVDGIRERFCRLKRTWRRSSIPCRSAPLTFPSLLCREIVAMRLTKKHVDEVGAQITENTCEFSPASVWKWTVWKRSYHKMKAAGFLKRGWRHSITHACPASTYDVLEKESLSTPFFLVSWIQTNKKKQLQSSKIASWKLMSTKNLSLRICPLKHLD